MKETSNDWYQEEAAAIDDETWHRAPDEEIAFFNAVAGGDLESVRQNCRNRRFESRQGVGQLSRDPVTNLKYHFVITAALLARTCIEGGMEHEKAFRLSDYYIKKLDLADSAGQVCELHDRMVLDYTSRMHLMLYHNASARPVNDSMNYIYLHIGEKLCVEEIAKAAGVSASYLSRAFRKELGITVNQYIRNIRIDLASNMLRYGNSDLAAIACRLGFSSQSHFIQVFHQVTGMTPKKYRSLHGRTSWKVRQPPVSPEAESANVRETD